MAYTVKALDSFRLNRHVSEDEILLCPVDPGVTTTPGSRYIVTNGVMVLSADSSAAPHFAAAAKRVSPAATQAFVRPDQVYGPGQQAKDLTLTPFRTLLSAGTPIELAKIGNYQDETVVSYDAATRAIACTTGFGADDRPNGALLYVYEGPGAGEVNIVEDYDHTGGAAELLLICHRPFEATLTTASKFVVLGSAAAANAVGIFGRGDLKDGDEFDCSDGADDGAYMVYADWAMLGAHLKNGHLPLVRTGALNRV